QLAGMHDNLPWRRLADDAGQQPDGHRFRALRPGNSGLDQRFRVQRRQPPPFLLALVGIDERAVVGAARRPQRTAGFGARRSMMQEAGIREVEQFLYREARLLDERRFRDWLELFTDDVRYWMVMRSNRYLRGSKALSNLAPARFADPDANQDN